MEEKQELIILEQLPVIKYQLEQLSKEIKEKVDNATSLVVNEDTVKEVKQVRANLNKEFTELESQRKQVKQAIMSKYDEFEEIYKENVSNLYKNADSTLKEKIDCVENTLKQEKEDELREFANQHIRINNLDDIITFEDIGLNITLSASIKSLKEQVLTFIENVANDVKLISMEEYSDEILLEYKKCRGNYAQCKLNVIERHRELEELKKKQEEKLEQEQQEEKIVEKVEEVITPPKEVIEDEDIIEVQFKVKGTKLQIKQIKELIIELGVEYE